DGEQTTALLRLRAPERDLQGGELLEAPDERAIEPARNARRVWVDGIEAKRRDRLGFALDLERLERPGLNRVFDERIGRLADQDRAVGRRLLQPLREIDRIPGDERLAVRRVSGDDGPRVDADPHLEPRPELRHELLVQLLEPCEHLRRSTDRTQGVVLVHDRDSEYGHDGVADELLDS